MIDRFGNTGFVVVNDKNEVLEITFALHVLAHIKVMEGWKLTPGKIYELPSSCDEEVARLNFPELGNNLTKLTRRQKSYLSGATLIEMDNTCKDRPNSKEDWC